MNFLHSRPITSCNASPTSRPNRLPHTEPSRQFPTKDFIGNEGNAPARPVRSFIPTWRAVRDGSVPLRIKFSMLARDALISRMRLHGKLSSCAGANWSGSINPSVNFPYTSEKWPNGPGYRTCLSHRRNGVRHRFSCNTEILERGVFDTPLNFQDLNASQSWVHKTRENSGSQTLEIPACQNSPFGVAESDLLKTPKELSLLKASETR